MFFRYVTVHSFFSESSESIANLLTKMCLQSEVINSGSAVKVTVPPTRSDVIHACDIIEDVAIAFGYNNIKMTLPCSATIGEQVSFSLDIWLALFGFLMF